MALIPQEYIETVVAIGILHNKKEKWLGSGFFYGKYLGKIDEEKVAFLPFLVTNKHVLEGVNKIFLRFNPQGLEESKDYWFDLIDKDDKPIWIGHSNPDIDVAILPIPLGRIRGEGMDVKYFKDTVDIADIEKMKELGCTEGDLIYTIGFPLGLIGSYRNYPLVRLGVISRIRDMLQGERIEFLIDAFNFPGGSGGPVILKPEYIAIEGTENLLEPFIIGIIKSYIPYDDYCRSEQTNEIRIMFQENSGLTEVVPMDFVQELIESYCEAHPDEAKPI